MHATRDTTDFIYPQRGRPARDARRDVPSSGVIMNPKEEAFVNAFVQKKRRERALFELGSESKRGRFIDRLCHDYAGVLDSRYLRPLPDPGHDPAGLLKRLKELRAGGTCHVISFNDEVDGKDIALEDAIRATLGLGLPSILICEPASLAYFEAEQVQGPPPRYLLSRRGGT